jgi:hypothetical protein
MILIEDHHSLSLEITTTTDAGERLHLTCKIAGIDLPNLQCWGAYDDLAWGDGRP